MSRLSWAAGSPMQKLQYAAIGLGGRGMFDVQSISRHEKVRMVAGADVESATTKKLAARMDDVKTFSDWREMFEIMGKDIDLVSVSTPDHMHGIMAMSAMNLGKHVYVQKPLAQTIGECRAMQETARKNKVIVQMGTQGASSFNDRNASGPDPPQIDWESNGSLGLLRKKLGRQESAAGPRRIPSPTGLDWDGWLGVGEKRPYLNKVLPSEELEKEAGLRNGNLGGHGLSYLQRHVPGTWSHRTEKGTFPNCRSQ